MKKLLLIALLLVIIYPLVLTISGLLGVQFPALLGLLFDTFGAAMIMVGILAMLKSTFAQNDVEGIYQGAFCALMGYSILNQSIVAFIAAVVLVAWIDHKGLSLCRSSR